MIQTLRGIRRLSATAAMKQAVTELHVPVPWGEIRGRVWGPDKGRPILCLHGWADNCGSFNTLIPLLPKEWKYVVVDLPGHGFSSHRSEGDFYTFPAYVSDVRRIVEALQWKRFSIIGHSMGGNIASLFSAVYPEMVESVVFLDVFGFLPVEMNKVAEAMRKGIDELIQYEAKKATMTERVYTYEKAAERLMAANPALSEKSAHILLERGCSQVEGGVVFTRDFRINLTNILRIPVEQCLVLQSQTQARVLVVLAEDGFLKTYNQPHHKEYVSALLDGYREQGGSVVTIAGDHHIHLNHPEAVASIVTEFLSGGPISVADPTVQESARL